LAWLDYRRLQVCDERRADRLLGFIYDLASTLICLKSLNQPKVWTVL
jgi:hypothetical protein